jgi:TetR/AcrR family transcriptional regulator, cholesterol catabolism regulator
MDEKKSEIIIKSAAIFMRYGIKSVTMDDLAKELMISKKTIYNHFKDKNELVTEIIKTKIEEEKCDCISAKLNAENAIDELFNISKMVIAKISSMNPAIFNDLLKHHPEAWALLTKHRWDYIYQSVLGNIERGIKEGIYREFSNPEIIARLNLSMTDLILNGETFPIELYKYEEVFEVTFRFQIHGMANEKGLKYLMSNYNTTK